MSATFSAAKHSMTLEPEIVIRHRNIPHTTERRTVNALHRWANTRETREREREREIERGRQNKRRKGRREQNKKGQNEKERETNTKKEEGDGDAGGKWND